jgi:hypothetical protein
MFWSLAAVLQVYYWFNQTIINSKYFPMTIREVQAFH